MGLHIIIGRLVQTSKGGACNVQWGFYCRYQRINICKMSINLGYKYIIVYTACAIHKQGIRPEVYKIISLYSYTLVWNIEIELSAVLVYIIGLYYCKS